MKNLITIAGIAVCCTLLSATNGAAHPGRTNSSGCHTNRKTGDYHCHNSGTSPSTPSTGTTPTQPVNPSGSGAIPSSSTLTVVSVGDGDTIRANHNGKAVTIRLACIDAPERAQNPWGTMASNRLKQILPKGSLIQIRTVDTDRYGRSVAEVMHQGQSINLQLVSEGLAAVYPQYVNNCNEQQFYAAQEQAKQAGRGIWNPSQRLQTMPWDYRKGGRS